MATQQDTPTPTYLVVIDLEATTSDDGTIPRDEMETIEIGAVRVDLATLDVVDTFQCFVTPVRHPQLTPFCTKLTGITQGMLDGAPTFPDAMAALQRAMFTPDEGETTWASWGKFDDTQLRRDCAYHGIAYLMPAHTNLKARFSEIQGRRRRFGMGQALRACGLTLKGAHHRALDDAKNIARLLPWILGNRRLA